MNKGDARIVLDRFGAFTIYGTCEDNAGSTRARIIATTSEPHSYVSAWDTDDDFNPGEENMIVEADSTSDNYDYGYEIYGMYSPSSERVVIDDDGQSTAVLVNTRGADCRFFSDR